ncbi:kinase-like domain-containing protein [Pavlovales sp. CCMP2436]|nr:kinase-like domain-containing protein [Pavlovales sp. CCMP2436]
MLTRLREHLRELDSSSISTPSALALRSLAGELKQVPAADLTFCNRLGQGNFAFADVHHLSEEPTLPEEPTFTMLSETDSFSKRDPSSRRESDVSTSSSTVLRKFSISSLFRRPTPCITAVPPGSRVVVVKRAKPTVTLALLDIAPGERIEAPMPASVSIQLLAEAVLLASLNHVNVVKFCGVTELVDPSTKLPTFGIVMEYGSGGTLLTKINAGGYSTDEAYGWLIDVARGMDHLHGAEQVEGQALCHRDLKLENILIAADGRALVADFGLFKFVSGSNNTLPPAQSLLPLGQTALRQAGTTGQTGTNRYMAPENWCATAHGATYDAKVDVFSFAILAWELLSKKRAYEGLYLTGEMLASSVATRGLRPPLPPKWPVVLQQLLSECWAEDAIKRPEFAEIAQRLADQRAAIRPANAKGGAPAAARWRGISRSNLSKLSAKQELSRSPTELALQSPTELALVV